jgi:hypothetical protein
MITTTDKLNGFFDAGGGLDKLVNTATKTITAVQTIKAAVKPPTVTGAPLVPMLPPAPLPPLPITQDYGKLAMIVGSVLGVGAVGYLLLKPKKK